MGFLGALFGGGQGAGFQAQGANVQNAFDPTQIQNAMAQTQGGIGQQQQLANALMAANGVGNQQNAYNALGGTAGQIGGITNQLQPGIAQAGNVANQLGGLAGQYQNIAAGQGPNPAEAMLAQATGQNVAQQGALAASQRNAGANVGLLNRQAALAGTNAQQQAAGQGATLQANQSLNALGQAGNALGQQAGVLGLQGNMIGSQAGILGQAGGLQAQQAGIANQQIGNQLGATGAVAGSQLANQQALTQGLGAQNQANVANASQQNQANSNVAAVNAKAQGDMTSGLLKGIGQAVSMGMGMPMADGGMVKNNLPSHLHDVASIYHGAQVPSFAYGGMPMKQGGAVPGEADKKGDHLSNDVVAAKLSPGEVVIPKSVVESDDPVGNAAKFMASVLKKEGQKSNPQGDFKDALMRAVKERKK